MKRLLPLLVLPALLATSADAKNLTINSREYEVDTLVYKHTVGPGTTYAYYRLPERPLDVFVLEVDMTNPYINLEVVNGGNAAVACETPSHMYARYADMGLDMVAAHNGDFYTTNVGEVGISRMGLIGANDCIFNLTGNPLFVVDDQRTMWCDYVRFNGTVTAGDKTTRLHTVNQLRLEWEPGTHADQLSLFTPAFGQKLHSASSGGTVAVVKPRSGSAIFPVNTELTLVVEQVIDNSGGQPIPEDGAVLYGLGSSSTFLQGLAEGQEIKVMLGASMPSFPDVKAMVNAIGGSGHIILRNGEICNINNPDVHPRTFVGVSQDRTKLYSVVVDGRTGASAGIDLDDQGRLLQWLGAWEGVNLDGGGSSCMVTEGEIKNHNSDGPERAVGNGVVYWSTAPADDHVARIGFEPRAYLVPITANFRPAIYAYNQYDLLLTRNLEGVTLSCDPQVGTINAFGEFVAAAEPATGNIYAEYEGVTASQPVAITMSALTLDYENYIIDNRGDYSIRMSAPVGRFTYGVDPACVEWQIADGSVCSIADGRMHGLENGTTTVSGTSANFAGTITVTTENVVGDTHPVLSVVDPSQWTLKQTGGTGITMAAAGEGWSLSYTGNGTARGANITMTPKERFGTYSLPTSMVMEINPGGAVITEITATYSDNHGGRGTFTMSKAELDPNATNVIDINLSDIIDVTDNTCYPVTFGNLKFVMGTSEKGRAYTIEIPRFEMRYGSNSAVHDVAVPAADTLDIPATVEAGAWVALADDSAAVLVYDVQGRLVARGRGGFSTEGMAQGVYMVSTASAAGRLVVR